MFKALMPYISQYTTALRVNGDDTLYKSAFTLHCNTMRHRLNPKRIPVIALVGYDAVGDMQ